jgi:hypothetical protein
MDYGLYRFEEPHADRRVRRRINYFGWTLAILLLTGLALAAWLGSFYIFNQPERPDSYRILQKLHKIEPPRRFELTAAPAGEFLNAKQLFDRYSVMGEAELAKTNAELARNYIRNFQQVRGLVPYVVGRYVIMEAREVGPHDLFTSGMVALTGAIENGELLMEHVYPAEARTVPLMNQTLTPGLEIKLERTHDLSAVIHVERLPDGRIMLTAIPLLYGEYTIMHGSGTFSLEPPLSLNLEAGWPLFNEQTRLRAEMHYASRRQHPTAPSGAVPIPGLTPTGTPPPPENQLVRVEAAKPVAVETPKIVEVAPKGGKAAKGAAKGAKLAKNQKSTPKPSPSTAPQVAEKSTSSQSALPAVVVATSPPRAAPTAAPAAVPERTTTYAPEVAMARSVETPVPAVPVQPAPVDSAGTLASTAGGGTWKTFPPGRMPLGRLVSAGDLQDIADRGTAGERIYLKGQFVVNFSDATRAVLRPRTRLADSVLHFGGSSSRIIVEFPSGYTPPTQGSVVSRDEVRPFEITEVRKQEDGQLNVFAREIMQP